MKGPSTEQQDKERRKQHRPSVGKRVYRAGPAALVICNLGKDSYKAKGDQREQHVKVSEGHGCSPVLEICARDLRVRLKQAATRSTFVVALLKSSIAPVGALVLVIRVVERIQWTGRHIFLKHL